MSEMGGDLNPVAAEIHYLLSFREFQPLNYVTKTSPQSGIESEGASLFEGIPQGI